jgi:hypothetical protein
MFRAAARRSPPAGIAFDYTPSWPDPPVPDVNGVPKEYAALLSEAAVTSLRSHKARAEEAEPCAAAPLGLQRTRYGEELSRPYHPSVLQLL